MNRHLSNDENTNGQQHRKRWLVSPATRGVKIKATTRSYLPPVRMPSIQISENSKCWWECVRKGTLICCCWGCKTVQPLWKTVCRFLRKLKIDLDSAIPLLGMYPKEIKSAHVRVTCTLFIVAHATITTYLATNDD